MPGSIGAKICVMQPRRSWLPSIRTDRGHIMGLLLDDKTRVIVQGITGREGQYHTRNMKAAGTPLVGGVTPGKGGITVEDLPVFDTVSEAKAATGANASCIFVPGPGAADAIMEAASAGIKLIVCISEWIPVIDMTRAMLVVREHGALLVGPNCPGLCTPGSGKIGIIPYQIFTPGPVGFISRSGTLTYEVVALLTEAGIGQSTCIGIGGDPIIGSTFADYLKLFEADPQTKVAALQAAKVPVADTIFDIPGLVKEALARVS